MKITICDVCKKEGKITETNSFLKVPRHPELRIDICKKHGQEIRKKYPRVDINYVKYVTEITTGIKLDDNQAKVFLR